MNPFIVLSRQQRLTDWKNFRTALSSMPEPDQLQAVAEYWGKAPIMTMAYDPEKLDELPTPWEMMSENDWCRNSVAIGMDFTLRLSGWSPERMVLKMIRDNDISDQKLILEIDGTTWLNYYYNMVTDAPNTDYYILESWQFTGKFYKKISI